MPSPMRNRTDLWLSRNWVSKTDEETLRKIGEDLEGQYRGSSGPNSIHPSLRKKLVKTKSKELRRAGLLPWYWIFFKALFLPFIEYVLFGEES